MGGSGFFLSFDCPAHLFPTLHIPVSLLVGDGDGGGWVGARLSSFLESSMGRTGAAEGRVFRGVNFVGQFSGGDERERRRKG